MLCLSTALLASCRSNFKPFDPVEHATLECIRSASWKVVSSREQSLVEELKRIKVVNTGPLPACFTLYPWWEPDSLVSPAKSAVDPKNLPETYLPPGKSMIIRIVHPVFFREGGILLASRQLTDEEIAADADARGAKEMGMIPFGGGRNWRITHDQLLGRGVLRVELTPYEGLSQQPDGAVTQEPAPSAAP